MTNLNRILRSLLSYSKNTLRIFAGDDIKLQKEPERYAEVIAKQFDYFNELSIPQKQRFLRRVHCFKEHKNFQYIGLEPLPEIPVLISPRLFRFTFGLRKKCHFSTRYVQPVIAASQFRFLRTSDVLVLPMQIKLIDFVRCSYRN